MCIRDSPRSPPPPPTHPPPPPDPPSPSSPFSAGGLDDLCVKEFVVLYSNSLEHFKTNSQLPQSIRLISYVVGVTNVTHIALPVGNRDTNVLTPILDNDPYISHYELRCIQPTEFLCSDSCRTASDNVCDDGGTGSFFSICDAGTDCTDCGSWFVQCPNTQFQLQVIQRLHPQNPLARTGIQDTLYETFNISKRLIRTTFGATVTVTLCRPSHISASQIVSHLNQYIDTIDTSYENFADEPFPVTQTTVISVSATLTIVSIGYTVVQNGGIAALRRLIPI